MMNIRCIAVVKKDEISMTIHLLGRFRHDARIKTSADGHVVRFFVDADDSGTNLQPNRGGIVVSKMLGREDFGLNVFRCFPRYGCRLEAELVKVFAVFVRHHFGDDAIFPLVEDAASHGVGFVA